jgi:hypothetical protein
MFYAVDRHGMVRFSHILQAAANSNSMALLIPRPVCMLRRWLACNPYIQISSSEPAESHQSCCLLLMVCCAAAELEAQLGIAEKTLAEFIIDVAKGSRNVDGFKKVGCTLQY